MKTNMDASCGEIGKTRFEMKNKISGKLMKILNNDMYSGLEIH